jgi:hypothetical protein
MANAAEARTKNKSRLGKISATGWENPNRKEQSPGWENPKYRGRGETPTTFYISGLTARRIARDYSQTIPVGLQYPLFVYGLVMPHTSSDSCFLLGVRDFPKQSESDIFR